ncbi:mediator complex subunit, partial [Cryomyces antarcticus]
MDQNGAEDPGTTKGKHTRNEDTTLPAETRKPATNGDYAFLQLDGGAEANRKDATTEGIYMNGLTSQDAHDTATPPSAMELHLQLPPELQQWTDNYLPFGKLLERVSQECVNDLHDAIDELADMQVPQTNAPPTNGINSLVPTNGVGGSSDINDRKKLRLMNFAQNHRDRFIKMLVLSDWSRNVDQVSKLIDLHVWFTSQRAAHDNAAFAMANMKRNMIGAKLPNPDLSTALEALSTGKAPRMPH